MGRYRKAITSLEKSLAAGEGMDQSLKNINRLSMADNYLALAQLNSVTGILGKALEYSSKALQIFRQVGEKRGEMEALLTMGSIYSDLGDLMTSENLIGQSLKISAEIKAGAARHYQLLAGIYSAMGKYEDAVRNQEKALEDATRFRIAGQIVWATVGMGDIYRELGDFRKAEHYYNQAREAKDTSLKSSSNIEASLDMRLGDIVSAQEYFTSEGSLTGTGISSLRLAELLLSSRKPDSALLLLNQAASAFRKSKNVQGTANVQLLKGSLMVDRGENTIAGRLLDSSRMATDFPETVWQSWYHLGRMFENQGNDEKATEAYRNSISVIEKIRGNLTIDEFKSIYFDSKRQVYDRLINILMKGNKSTEAFQVSEMARARAFYDIISNKKINFRGSAAEDLMSLEQQKRIEMQKLYKLLQKGYTASASSEGSRGADLRQVRNSLTQVQSEYAEIMQKLKLNNPAYSEMVSAEPVSLKDIQSRIDPESAALEYWVSDKELIIWMITQSRILSKTIGITSGQLASLVERTRQYIQINSKEEMNPRLRELYSKLIEPFEKELAPFSNLIIIPNQSLHFLPFQALLNKKGEYLVQKQSLVYAPSASLFIVCNDRIVKAGSKFMGMALSDVMVGSNPGLPGTEAELKKILPLFPDNISRIGTESTESFAKKNASNYNFLHFATHGSNNLKQPLYSYLLFPPADDEDGRLSVYEVFEMDLNARLVTLSACETGLGNITRGDELTGLSRAFLFAGSSTVVVSLWPVADYPTAMLMANFYSYLKDNSMQEALAMAQRDVIKQYPEPSYWAPFVLIGNGSLTTD
jgi:CHAT domain-containing protein/Flp pilus assembly protein TadD